MSFGTPFYQNPRRGFPPVQTPNLPAPGPRNLTTAYTGEGGEGGAVSTIPGYPTASIPQGSTLGMIDALMRMRPRRPPAAPREKLPPAVTSSGEGRRGAGQSELERIQTEMAKLELRKAHDIANLRKVPVNTQYGVLYDWDARSMSPHQLEAVSPENAAVAGPVGMEADIMREGLDVAKDARFKESRGGFSGGYPAEQAENDAKYAVGGDAKSFDADMLAKALERSNEDYDERQRRKYGMGSNPGQDARNFFSGGNQ